MRHSSRIWGDSISGRLSGARQLSSAELAAVHRELCRGCPVEPWPYGNATSINPLLATLGISPGASPNRADTGSPQPLDLPTAGIRHPHTEYDDGKGFWRRVRCLARAALPTETADDAYALFGNMNLDAGRSGSARDVRIDPAFGTWVLRTIRDRLRPRFLVCLGIKSHCSAVGLLKREFDGFDVSKPHVEHRLQCAGSYRFREWEWDCTAPAGGAIKIVLWPNHPSRHPFSNIEAWKSACAAFANRHGNLLRP